MAFIWAENNRAINTDTIAVVRVEQVPDGKAVGGFSWRATAFTNGGMRLGVLVPDGASAEQVRRRVGRLLNVSRRVWSDDPPTTV